MAKPIGEACSSSRHGGMPPPACLCRHLGTLPTVTQRSWVHFQREAPPAQGTVLDNPHVSPFSQHADLCPPRLKPALPSKAGGHTKTLWCRCADTVPCHPLSCKRDQEGSKQPARGQVLRWERTSYRPTWPGQGAELRASILPSPAPGVQRPWGSSPLRTRSRLSSAVPLLQGPGFRSRSQALRGQRAPHSQENLGIYSHRQVLLGRHNA